PFGPVNPIGTPYGQFVFNYTHPRKCLCSVSFDHIARGQGNLTEARTDVRPIIPMGAREVPSTEITYDSGYQFL
ncbi:hypothetical protein AVEN_120977-1, partial [Araneus ventricosus]